MSQRTIALVFAALLLGHLIPAVGATHTDGITPDVPLLPRARPTDDCIPTGVTPQVLARVNQLLANDPRFFSDELGVASLCLAGQPVDQYKAVIARFDEVLQIVRNLSTEVQRNVDVRLDKTLPEGESACRLARNTPAPTTVPVACGLVEPRTILLSDTFNGRRVGGFGDWKVVTQGGEDPVWTIAQTQTPNGTRHTFRFGEGTSYPRGAHQWLVSPEIDLTALNGNQTAIRNLVVIRDLGRGLLDLACGEELPQGLPTNANFACGQGREFVPGMEIYPLLYGAYEAQIDDLLNALPVMKQGAHLNLTFRMNLAPGEDGVRFWIYSGDRQPDQRVLFHEDLGKNSRLVACPTGPAALLLPAKDPNSPLDARSIVNGSIPPSGQDVVCTQPLTGADNRSDLPLMAKTRAFNDPSRSHLTSVAFTGDSRDFVTIRLNLTEYMDRRIWLLFESKTLRNDRGIDIFSDVSRFPRPQDFGFEISHVYAEGSGYHRNLRLKDIGATFTYQQDGNEFGDANTTRTTLPPGNESIVAWVHNAGDYIENATLTVTVDTSPRQAAPRFTPLGTYSTKVRLVPDEVQAVRIPWSAVLTSNHPTLREGNLYALHANLTLLGERDIPPIGDQADTQNLTQGRLPSAADANATPVRPANAAGVIPGAGALTLHQDVRAAALRNLTPLRADGARGNPIEFCERVEGRTCEPIYANGGRGHYAGRKGEPRVLLTGVRNDGNVIQDAQAELVVELDGVSKPDVVTDGIVRELRALLPGENRPLTWTLVPTEPGAYRVAVALIRENGERENLVERRLYVQRSTAIICLDDLATRECGPSFLGDLAPALREENITASYTAPDGTLYVATEIREVVGNLHSGQLAARDPVTGAWKILANLSGTNLNNSFSSPQLDHGWGKIRGLVVDPKGDAWLVGDNATALHRNKTTGALTRIPILWNPAPAEGTPPPALDIHAALWHADTLLAAGSNGTMLRFDGKNLTTFSVNVSGVRYNGTFRDLAHGPNGFAYAVGDKGVALFNEPAKGLTNWGPITVAGSVAHDVFRGATLRAIGVRQGVGEHARVYIGGDGVLLANQTANAKAFQNLTLPLPQIPGQTTIDIAQGSENELVLLTARGAGYDAADPVRAVGKFFRTGIPSGVNLTHVCAWSQQANRTVQYAITVQPSNTTVVHSGTINTTQEAGWSCASVSVPWVNETLFLQRLGGNATVGYDPATPGTGDSYIRIAGAWIAQPDITRGYRLIFAGEPPIVVEQGGQANGVDLGMTGLADCTRCHEISADWEAPEVARPPVVGATTHPAQFTRIERVGEKLVLLGEAGLVLERQHRGEYDNVGSWSTLPALAARDGGVITTLRGTTQVLTGKPQSYIGLPDAAGQGVAEKATKFRLFLNHSVRNATPLAAVEVRLMYRHVPNSPMPVGVPGMPQTCGPNDAGGVTTVCNDPRVRYEIARFEQPTQLAGWHEAAYLDIPAQEGAFFAFELYVDKDTRWVIDDVRLQGLVEGTGWRDIITWYGPTLKTGNWFMSDLSRSANIIARTELPEIAASFLRGGGSDQPVWGEWFDAVDQETVSAWHATTQYADRPVFAANNEAFAAFPGGNSPRLLSNWDTRLVSPVIDLGDAYDPVITFRHTYAFRMKTNGPSVRAGDGGTLEVQYLLQGADCGARSEAVTCGWSPFFTIQPDGGYPRLSDLRLDGLGYVDHTVLGQNILTADPGRIGYDPQRDVGLSYWARTALPNERGIIDSPRLTSTYDTVRVTLNEKSCNAVELSSLRNAVTSDDPDCVHFRAPDGRVEAVNLTGRQIRFAFRLQTVGNNDHAVFANHLPAGDTAFNFTSTGAEPGTTFAGEGWYITDFKVLGARKLGIDLRASNMTYQVGYDPSRIGLGPGTSVPINVTIENRGTFDVLGYTGVLEIRRVINRGLGTSEIVETIQLPQQPVLDADARAQHSFLWNVPPQEGAEYFATFRVDPIGIARDEDPIDNLATLGTIAQPTLARTVRQFNTEFLVSPQDATADIPRYLPIFINNTGNVPISNIVVERRITKIGASTANDPATCAEWSQIRHIRPTSIVECKTWNTTQAAPPGVRSALTALSTEVSPTTDLFWRAPEPVSFIVAVGASARIGASTLLAGGDAPRRVSAFATFLFDDVEGGLRGSSLRGTWNRSPDWNVSQPGFRSAEAYSFGEAANGRYPANANSTLTTPTVDLSTARTASLAFYQKFALENGFDAGVIEASADGGATWHRLDPIVDPLTKASYNKSVPLQASSPAHLSGDPLETSYGFTSNSSLLPVAVDGWALSQIDFTNFANVTEKDVAYERYGPAELQRYPAAGLAPIKGNLYSHDNWCPGARADDRCWDIENLAEAITSPVPAKGTEPNTFWWSGSASADDDQKRPIQNNLLWIEIDVSRVELDQKLEVEWWEYTSRHGASGDYTRFGSPLAGSWPDPIWPDDLLTVFTYALSGINAKTYRFNVGSPEIIESKGNWHRMQSDISFLIPEIKRRGLTTLPIGFAYTPLGKYSSLMTLSGDALNFNTDDTWRAEFGPTTDGSRGDYGFYGDDRGLAIDGFQVSATRLVRGQPVGAPEVLADERTAWDRKQIYECGRGTVDPTASNDWATGNRGRMGCLDVANDWIKRTPVTDEPGRTWSVVPHLPRLNATWQVVDVRDEDGFSPTRKLPTGDVPKAWWTGQIPGDVLTSTCARNLPCQSPGSEGRLVTPAFDLARIAGDNAAFSFTHRYSFHTETAGIGGFPLASGGVVEIQVFDPQTGRWGDWKQIYSSTNFSLGPVPSMPMGTGRGGYSHAVANTSAGTNGVFRFDPSFETLLLPDGRGKPQAVQFLYSGTSTSNDTYGSKTDGWVRASYDVSSYLGRKVRFAFHYAYSHQQAIYQNVSNLQNPDGFGQNEGGWWVKDVAVTGNVIIGAPVQVRWRAATDANLQEGGWLLDDIGIFGSRYTENLGIFVDTTPQRFGAYPNKTATVPITIRNLGTRIQDDLAIEVVNTNPLVPLAFDVVGAPQGGKLDGATFRIKGIGLGAGQSITVNLTVRTPLDSTQLSAKLLVLLKRENTQTGDFGHIANNEVQGLLSRTIDFHLQKNPRIERVSAIVQQLTPQVGEPVELDLTYHNPGFGPTVLNVTCIGQVIKDWKASDHRGNKPQETPHILAEYPCTLVSGSPTVAAKATSTLRFRVTPTEAGFLSFRYNVSVLNGSEIPIERAGIAVGVPPLQWKMGFDTQLEFAQNFTGQAHWEYFRGNAKSGSLAVGINENATTSGLEYSAACGGGACIAAGPPVDLHNYSNSTPAFLSLWHQDRLAKFDGAQVKARILENEENPGSPSSWAASACLLRPMGGYEGVVRQDPDDPASVDDPIDLNPAFSQSPQHYAPENFTTERDFFVTPNGQWENTWSLATFDLSKPCELIDGDMRNYNETYLLGRTIRIEFHVFPSVSRDSLKRGPGHAFLVDDISIGPFALDVRPTGVQRATLVDDTKKAFHVVVANLGPQRDRFALAFDAANSSIAPESLSVPTTAFDLAPGERRIVPVHVTLPRDPSLLPTDFKARLLARSLIDPNAAGATSLDIAFAPRKWAELAVSVTRPAGIVQEGTETFIPITIENTGLADSVASRLRILDTWGTNRSAETFLELPSIRSYADAPDESTRVFEYRWRPEAGSIGPHKLTFTVDPAGLGEEYTRENNVVTIDVPVSELLIPDLHVANRSALTLRNAVGAAVTPALDADVGRYEVIAGELVTFEIKVANRGRAGATNVDVRAFIGALSLPPKTIPYIGPGTEAAVQFNWLAQKGEHPIEVVVRSEQVELTTSNNRYPGVGVTILTVKAFDVLIEIPDLTALLEPGATVEVPFSVTNTGNAGEDLVLKPQAPAGMRLMLPREGFYLRAGEAYRDVARLILDAEAVAGQQFISIDAMARENPMKAATGRAGIRVNASYGGSVTPTLAHGMPPSIVLPIEVTNEGNSLEPWSIVPDLPAGWSVEGTLPVKLAVPAHGKAKVDLQLKVPESTAPGERVVRIKATMPNGETRESVARVAVAPLRTAGLAIQEATPRPDRGALLVPVIVENTGNVKLPFSVVLLDVPPGLDLRVEPSRFELPPGGKAVAELLVRPNATIQSGTYAVTSYALFEGVTPQTSEGRANLQTLRVPVVRQDLRLAPLEYAPRAGLDAGDRVSVKVGVTNRGLTEIADVPVHLYVDDVFIEETRIARIPGGARVDVTFNWTAVEGVHTLTAVVDPYADTVDADRADNAVSALATVGTELPTGGIAAGRADTPGLGIWGALLAIGAALLATRSQGRRRQRR